VQGLSKHTIGEFIHGKLNHTSTVTGRLSSTNPNLQNISNNPIKQIFNSRFNDGLIVEVDFNQLEVVALAHVTRDKQLIADISKGIDIHSALYKDMFGRMPTKEERKPFKSRTFQLIYGAGAKAISKQAGCSFEEAKKFIDVFYTRYPDVAKWHKDFAVRAELESLYQLDDDGFREKVKTFVFQTETGRKFCFREYFSDSTWSPKTYNFSPTELKNYPIQGLATGDIVPMMLGIIFRKLVGRDDVKMVNTIHDSLMFDVDKDSAVNFILEITDILKDTHKYFEKIFKAPLALKLNAGASYGVNWFDMKEM
jgi:DNA polymerase I-like protein with 3'-5' exonuclease and polymerase domains